MIERELYLPSGEVHKIEVQALDSSISEIASGREKLKSMKLPHLPRKTEMLVVFNDTQLSRNGDHEAVGAFLQFVDHYKNSITHLVANGDILDLEQASKFSKTPDMEGTMTDEIMAGRYVFSRLSLACPKAKKVFVMGNHDQRTDNFLKDRHDGSEEWMRTWEEMFHLKELGWTRVEYGRGKYFKWHDMIFWHGARAGTKSDIAKLELEDAGVSGASGHINRNMFKETRTALGEYKFWATHGGFSRDNLNYVKNANTRWAQGFGVYYFNKEVGIQPYMVIMRHGNPRFIWEGQVFDGTGFEIPTDGRKQ